MPTIRNSVTSLTLQVQYNKLTQEEANLADKMITQQILLDSEKLSSGKKPTAAASPTTSDFIGDNLSLSQSAPGGSD